MTPWRARLVMLLVRARNWVVGEFNWGQIIGSVLTTSWGSPAGDVHADDPSRVNTGLISPSNKHVADPTGSTNQDELKDQHRQVRQLIKQALEEPTLEDLTEFLEFTNRFRRLAVWNARMAHIQRPGARIIASEYEWTTVGRYVLPDAVPIIILWPFSPIRFVYELEDTGPPIDRDNINDPFAARGEFRPRTLSTLESNLKRQKSFRIEVEARRQGFSYAGSAVAQGVLSFAHSAEAPLADGKPIGAFVQNNAVSAGQLSKRGIPAFRITVNDRLEPIERFVTLAHELGHIFCGHLGACSSLSGREEESGWPDRQSLGKDEKEVEAEAIAYLVASRAEIITGSAVYLKRHAQDAEMAKINLDLIVRAAARIERLAKIHYGTMVFKPQSGASTPPTSEPRVFSSLDFIR